MAQTVKHLPTMQETRVQSLGREDLLEKEMATHSSILAWKIPWRRNLVRLQSMVSQRVGTTGMLGILSCGRQCFFLFVCLFFFSFPSKHVRDIYLLQLTSCKLAVFGIYFCNTAPGPFLRASVIKSPPGLVNWKCE